MSSNPSNFTSATVCGDRTGGDAGCQEVGMCSARGGSQECTLHLPLQKVNKAESTLALKPRGDITRNPKQWYQWSQKRTCVSAKNFLKKKVVRK